MLNKVEICGINTAELPILREKEKSQLLALARQGDQQARSKLVNGNLRLVLNVIQRFSSRGENPDDLFQVGCIGLIKAIDNFDLSLNVRFSTYAVPMIIGEIRRHLRDFSPVRVSRSLKDTAYKAMQSREKLTASKGREPTASEIAADIQTSRESVVMALESIVSPVSLYEPVFSEGNDTVCVMDQISDPACGNSWDDEISLRDAFSRLSDREKKILHLRFFRGKTQVEVSAEIGISQAQVSRLEKAALLKVKGD